MVMPPGVCVFSSRTRKGVRARGWFRPGIAGGPEGRSGRRQDDVISCVCFVRGTMAAGEWSCP